MTARHVLVGVAVWVALSVGVAAGWAALRRWEKQHPGLTR